MTQTDHNFDCDRLFDVQTKEILHWNYRGFTSVPDELRFAGKQLAEVYMKWNFISQMPKWFTSVTHLTNLYLFGNEISSLPEELGSMTSLTELDVGHNKLTCLPSSIVQLKNLHTLYLEFNLLTSLPCDIGNLKKLTHLKINGNKIKFLPNSLCLCESITELLADYNELQFLPQNIVYLQNLDFLSVRSNQLRFLPAVAFCKSIEILFDDNPYLNHLSSQMNQYLLRLCSQMNRSSQHGTFVTKERSESLPSKDHALISNCIYVKEGNRKLILPPSLSKLKRHNESGCLISLRELCLRIVYSMLYHQCRQNSSCIQNPINQVLPTNIVDLFLDGPTVFCQICSEAIFKEAILIVLRPVVFYPFLNQDQLLYSCVYVCTKNCFLTNVFNEFIDADSIVDWTF